MSKHKKDGEERDAVGKAGAPASATENEKGRTGKDEKPGTPKISKDDVGGGRSGGPVR